jgi:SAM-dependent methyltransferase
MKLLDTAYSDTCPICGSEEVRLFLDLPNMPAQDGLVYTTRKAAIDAPVGDIKLAVCEQCHFVGNLAHDTSLINFVEYSYSKYHSQQYRRHVSSIITMLVENYSVRNKTVIDVGCGEGYFLNELCRAGDNRGIGIDPSLPAAEKLFQDDSRLVFVKDYYTDEHLKYASDVTCCRHVLDELAAPMEMIKLITRNLSLDGDGLIYIEVPNALQTFTQKLVWNIGYAKRSWFTSSSLQTLLELCGYEILSSNPLFGEEYLGVVARRSSAAGERAPANQKLIPDFLQILDDFSGHLGCEIQRWQRKILELKQRGEQMVIWGAGMRGINFLHHFGDVTMFPKIVDISVDRQGCYLPGSGYLVEAPEVLETFRPTCILVSNPNYIREISAQIEEMGLGCELELL